MAKQHESMNGNSRAALSFLIGVAGGAAGALLLAPKSGRELRSDISERANEATDNVASLARTGSERAGEQYERTSKRAREAVEGGRKAVTARREALREAFSAGMEAYEKELERL